MPKKLAKNALTLGVVGLGTAVGAQVLSESGSPEGAAAMGKISGALPLAGGLMATGFLLDQTKKLGKFSKRR